MQSLFLVLAYILIFEVFEVNLSLFLILMLVLMLFYHISENKKDDSYPKVKFPDSLFLKQNVVVFLSWFLFFAYYFWKIEVFSPVVAFVILPIGCLYGYLCDYVVVRKKD